MALAVDTPRPIESPGTAIRVRGLVQGVGFRPHAWRLARDCGLAGEVWNDAEGVLVRIWGPAAARQRFLLRLRAEAPPLARIDALEIRALDEAPPPGFRILPSHAGLVRTGVVPDAATCPACLADLCDPDDRRHRYAFTNCTQCGPRLSIVRAIPYDRGRTSMAGFTMCRVAAALGICRGRASYEGQPALELEACIDDAALAAAAGGYPFAIERAAGQSVLDPGPMWQALLADLVLGTPVPVMAARFHLGLADAVLDLVWVLSRGPAEPVALSGGVFQNRLLLERVSEGLRARGLSVLSHRLVPAGDGGLELGQAGIAAARARTPPSHRETLQCV